MYQSLGAKTGVKAVNDAVSKIVKVTPDGLTLDTSKLKLPAHAGMSDRLFNFLLDLRLLRNVPLTYLVPDPALLPAESIRFFHVDPTWVDRIVDGVFAAANTGSVDRAFSAALVQLVRVSLDSALVSMTSGQAGSAGWKPASSEMTGMLMRSDVVRRWPDLQVNAYADEQKTKPIAVLRKEAISKYVLIALFAGEPKLVEVREPFVGVRFGVEMDDKNKCPQDQYKLDKRTAKGDPVDGGVVCVKLNPGRVIDIANLASQVGSPRMVAIHLEQKAYIQEFKGSNEARGSVSAFDLVAAKPGAVLSKVPLRKGRFMNLTALAEQEALLKERGEL